MREKILVFKGFVCYRSWLRRISCDDSDFTCFDIMDVEPGMVEAGDNARVQVFSKKQKLIIGDELWSDGEKYIVASRWLEK